MVTSYLDTTQIQDASAIWCYSSLNVLSLLLLHMSQTNGIKEPGSHVSHKSQQALIVGIFSRIFLLFRGSPELWLCGTGSQACIEVI